jgi:hypothetical protein
MKIFSFVSPCCALAWRSALVDVLSPFGELLCSPFAPVGVPPLSGACQDVYGLVDTCFCPLVNETIRFPPLFLSVGFFVSLLYIYVCIVAILSTSYIFSSCLPPVITYLPSASLACLPSHFVRYDSFPFLRLSHCLFYDGSSLGVVSLSVWG